MGERLRQLGMTVTAFCRVFVLWLLFAAVCGAVCGAAGAAFHHAVEYAGGCGRRTPG